MRAGVDTEHFFQHEHRRRHSGGSDRQPRRRTPARDPQSRVAARRTARGSGAESPGPTRRLGVSADGFREGHAAGDVADVAHDALLQHPAPRHLRRAMHYGLSPAPLPPLHARAHLTTRQRNPPFPSPPRKAQVLATVHPTGTSLAGLAPRPPPAGRASASASAGPSAVRAEGFSHSHSCSSPESQRKIALRGLAAAVRPPSADDGGRLSTVPQSADVGRPPSADDGSVLQRQRAHPLPENPAHHRAPRDDEKVGTREAVENSPHRGQIPCVSGRNRGSTPNHELVGSNSPPLPPLSPARAPGARR